MLSRAHGPVGIFSFRIILSLVHGSVTGWFPFVPYPIACLCDMIQGLHRNSRSSNAISGETSSDMYGTVKHGAGVEQRDGVAGLDDGGDDVEQDMSKQTTMPKGKVGFGRGWMLSAMSMLLLVVQGTMMSVVLRYSRIQEGSMYLPSVSVCMAEAIKLSICIAYLLIMGDTKIGKQLPTHQKQIGDEESKILTYKDWKALIQDSVPMALPASMFVFQQVLLIWSATYLDAVTYQIFNQAFKLVPTAVFARVLLGQKLKPMQWMSLPVLAFGVILITTNNNSSSSSGSSEVDGNSLLWYAAMVACSLAGLSSAFAGVYFEKYVKGKLAGSLIRRNLQLGIYGVPFSCIYALMKDGQSIRENGPLSGFGQSAWGVVWLQVFGGFIIALVVKYCDNILKNFALAGSVILTVLVSIPLFNQWPSSFFLFGVTAVLLSVFMYGGSMRVPKQFHNIYTSARKLAMEHPFKMLLMNVLCGAGLFVVVLRNSNLNSFT